MNAHPASRTDADILITRTFDAPRELVFRAWTEPAHLQTWFAPRGCTLTVIEMDVREGGVLHLGIRHPQFGDCWTRGVYEEVRFPERLVYTACLVDADGNRIDSTGAGKDPDWPSETTVTITFEERDGGTLVTLHQNAPESVARRTGAYPSWLEMLDRLAETLDS